MFSPEQIFWCTILTNRVKPLKYNYSSTLVIQGLLEAITAMMPSQMFQTSLKKINLKTPKKYNKMQWFCSTVVSLLIFVSLNVFSLIIIIM